MHASMLAPQAAVDPGRHPERGGRIQPAGPLPRACAQPTPSTKLVLHAPQAAVSPGRHPERGRRIQPVHPTASTNLHCTHCRLQSTQAAILSVADKSNLLGPSLVPAAPNSSQMTTALSQGMRYVAEAALNTKALPMGQAMRYVAAIQINKYR